MPSTDATFLDPRSVRAQIAVLRRRPTALFGAHAHRFRLNRPLGASGLAALESDYPVDLPEDYRGFVRDVADGGAGPGYGLLRLSVTLPHAARVGEPFHPHRNYASSRMHDPARTPPGLLTLSDEGCGEKIALAVAGPERGSLWWNPTELAWIPVSDGWKRALVAHDGDWLAAHRWVRTHLRQVSRTTFSMWYAAWLVEATTACWAPGDRQDL